MTSELEDPVLKESIYILYDMIEISSDADYFIRKQFEAKKEAKNDKQESAVKSFVLGVLSWIKNVWVWITTNIFRI